MKRNSSKMAAVGLVMTVMAAISSCGGDDAPNAATLDPRFVFDGRYTQTITVDDDVPRFLIGEIEWEWDDGNYRVTFRDDEDLWIAGSYVVDGDRVTITEEDGPRKCAAGTETATYFWNVDGDQLRFSPTDEPDLCDGRKDAVPAVPFMR